MKIRILSGIIGLAALVPLMIIGGVWLQIGLAFVVVTGMREFYAAFEEIKTKHMAALILTVLFIVLSPPGGDALLWMSLLSLLFLAWFSRMAFVELVKKEYEPKGREVVIGFAYVAMPLYMVFLLRDGLPLGQFHIWLIFISAWGCDTGAYFTGLTMGRRKLAPVLSPKKTWEGSIGGTIVATILAAAYGLILYNLGILAFEFILIYAVTAFVCSIAGQIGDLTASAIKRGRGLKDFGKIMPGHGGVLDRFDSIIYVAPLAMAVLAIVDRLF